jgi:hypothetical protein
MEYHIVSNSINAILFFITKVWEFAPVSGCVNVKRKLSSGLRACPLEAQVFTLGANSMKVKGFIARSLN